MNEDEKELDIPASGEPVEPTDEELSDVEVPAEDSPSE